MLRTPFIQSSQVFHVEFPEIRFHSNIRFVYIKIYTTSYFQYSRRRYTFNTTIVGVVDQGDEEDDDDDDKCFCIEWSKC